MGFFSKGFKNEFQTAMVNEPSEFEPLKFYCILLSSLSSLTSYLLPRELSSTKMDSTFGGKIFFRGTNTFLSELIPTEKVDNRIAHLTGLAHH